MFSYTEIREKIPRLEDDPEGDLPIKTQANRLGVSDGVVRRALAQGLDPYKADRMCIKGLGLHPASVFSWDDWCLADDIQKGEDGMPLDDCDALKGARQRKSA